MILFEVNDFNKRYSIVLYTQIRIYRPGPKADMPSLSLSLSNSLFIFKINVGFDGSKNDSNSMLKK